MNKNLLLMANSLLLIGCGGSEYAEIQGAVITMSADGVGPFYECFDSGYNDTIILSEDAYQKGECFMSLVQENTNLDQNTIKKLAVGANQHTILQYADSWYAMAASKDHPLAKLRLNHNQLALYSMESNLLGREKANAELLASEKEFNFLDTDQSGLLTIQEGLANQALAQAFFASDFNEDGKISIDEYIIFSSEATAAGNKDQLQDQLE